MKKKFVTNFGIFALILTTFLALSKTQVYAIPPTNVKDTMSSSQLSWFSRIDTGTTYMDSVVKISLTGVPSQTTNNLFENDVVCIGNSVASNQGCTQYSVRDIGNTGFFEISTTLPANVATVGNYIIATRSAQHVVNFIPQSNITSGKWQFLIRATSSTSPQEYFNDGMPDQFGFDIGNTNAGAGGTGPGVILRGADVTCPWASMTVSGIGATVGILASNGTTYYYHTIVCSLAAGGTNPIGGGTTATWSIGSSSTSNATQITNPTRSTTSTTEGVADSYNFFIRHTDSAGVVFDGDTARGQVAVVESVRVTATVDPTISFIIDNVGTTNVGTSVCAGANFSAGAGNVTATQVPFGSLLLQAFNNLGQRVSATTNAAYGYAVTVYEDGPMTMIGGSSTIPDTTCDSSCSISTAGTWGNAAVSDKSRFGYTLTAVGGSAPSTMAFTTGTNQYKPFGIGSTSAVNIFSNSSTPSTWERSYVCYRLAITNAQAAGNYENKVVYTATATF